MTSNILNYSKGILEDAEAVLYDLLHERECKLSSKWLVKWHDLLMKQNSAYVKDVLNIAMLAIGVSRPYPQSAASDAQLATLVSQLEKRDGEKIAAIKAQRAANAAAKQ